MKNFVIVGRPNSGKTLFALNFAGYLGVRTVNITFNSLDGLLFCREYELTEAKKELCSAVQHKTRCVQSMILKIRLGKALVNFKLTDTCGVAENISSEENLRRGMAQTLSFMRSADFIIHIFDLMTVKSAGLPAEGVDWEIFRYGMVRNRYVLLVNKIDLPAAKQNLSNLTTAVQGAGVIPVSARYNYGFKEVKTYVARNI